MYCLSIQYLNTKVFFQRFGSGPHHFSNKIDNRAEFTFEETAELVRDSIIHFVEHSVTVDIDGDSYRILINYLPEIEIVKI